MGKADARLVWRRSSRPSNSSTKQPPSAPTAIRCSSLFFRVSERKRQPPRHMRVMHWKEAEQWVTALKASPVPMNMRSEEHTSELQSLMRISYAVFCLKKKKEDTNTHKPENDTYNISMYQKGKHKRQNTH